MQTTLSDLISEDSRRDGTFLKNRRSSKMAKNNLLRPSTSISVVSEDSASIRQLEMSKAASKDSKSGTSNAQGVHTLLTTNKLTTKKLTTVYISGSL